MAGDILFDGRRMGMLTGSLTCQEAHQTAAPCVVAHVGVSPGVVQRVTPEAGKPARSRMVGAGACLATQRMPNYRQFLKPPPMYRQNISVHISVGFDTAEGFVFPNDRGGGGFPENEDGCGRAVRARICVAVIDPRFSLDRHAYDDGARRAGVYPYASPPYIRGVVSANMAKQDGSGG